MTTDVADEQSPASAGEEADVAKVPTGALSRTRARPFARAMRLVLAVLTAQYTLIAIGTGLSVAATVKYVVTPQIMARLEAVSAALKR